MCQSEEQDLANDAASIVREKKLLDAALAEYEKDCERGRSWREVLGDLRARKRS